jgi:hypothetical protein
LRCKNERRKERGTELNTVIDNMPINKAVAIFEDNKLLFCGTPISFIGWKKPKHFRSRAVLSMYAENDILVIHISKAPTFAERSENVV